MKVIIKGDSMWPKLNDGDTIDCVEYTGQVVDLKSLIVFTHPFKSSITCVKRVSRIEGERFFVEGDNPDPLASEDSHNFGWVHVGNLIAVGRESHKSKHN